MNALLVDDERLARAELRRLLAAHPDVQVVAEAATADEAVRAIETRRPDLVLLDIELAGATGFSVLEKLDWVPAVVFVTAYDQYAVRAFEVSAFDYLLKPVEPERLAAALEKVRRGGLAAHPPEAPLGPDSRVFVRDGEKGWFVRLADVVLVEGEGNYARLYFGAEKPLILRSLAALEKRLDPAHFFRANRRQIVGLAHVTDVQPWFAGALVLRAGGHRVEVSRRQAQKLRAHWQL